MVYALRKPGSHNFAMCHCAMLKYNTVQQTFHGSIGLFEAEHDQHGNELSIIFQFDETDLLLNQTTSHSFPRLSVTGQVTGISVNISCTYIGVNYSLEKEKT